MKKSIKINATNVFSSYITRYHTNI